MNNADLDDIGIDGGLLQAGPSPLSEPNTSSLVNRNIVSSKGRTSIRLEPEIWNGLFEICDRESISMTSLIDKIDKLRQNGGRTSAIRTSVFEYFRSAATEIGHAASGHGTNVAPSTVL